MASIPHTSQFFTTQGKDNMEQTDIRITAENGLNFSQDQTIGIYIPPSIKYFSGKDSYLQFDCLIKGDAQVANLTFPTRLTLDPNIGANSLFSSVRIYAGNRETLIEENTEYASYVSLKYDFSKNDVEQNKRAMTEGCGVHLPESRGTLGTTKSIGNNHTKSPFMKQFNRGADTDPKTTLNTAWTNSDFIPAKMTLPLHCGVFADQAKVFPNLLTNGIYIELTMAPARNLFRQLDSVALHRRLRLNPFLDSVDKAGAKAKWESGGDAVTKFYIKGGVNMSLNPSEFPFVVGERIGFAKDNNDGAVSKATFTGGNATIKSISQVAGDIVVEVDNALSLSSATIEAWADGDSESWFLYSSSLLDATSYAPSCEVSNVEMIVHQITMDDSYEKAMLGKVSKGGVVNFDIPSVGVHTHSTLASDVQSTVPLNIDYSMAKSILCVPTDAGIYSADKNTAPHSTYLVSKDAGALNQVDTQMRSNRTGLAGCSNGLSKYSFFLNGKMVPTREISTAKVSDKRGGIDANYLVELEKALLSFGIPVNSFEEYASNFVVGRVLAIGEENVFDGRGRTARLNCRYEGTTDNVDKPSVNLLWKNFIRHIRTLSIKSGNVEVMM